MMQHDPGGFRCFSDRLSVESGRSFFRSEGPGLEADNFGTAPDQLIAVDRVGRAGSGVSAGPTHPGSDGKRNPSRSSAVGERRLVDRRPGWCVVATLPASKNSTVADWADDLGGQKVSAAKATSATIQIPSGASEANGAVAARR